MGPQTMWVGVDGILGGLYLLLNLEYLMYRKTGKKICCFSQRKAESAFLWSDGWETPKWFEIRTEKTEVDFEIGAAADPDHPIGKADSEEKQLIFIP